MLKFIEKCKWNDCNTKEFLKILKDFKEKNYLAMAKLRK